MALAPGWRSARARGTGLGWSLGVWGRCCASGVGVRAVALGVEGRFFVLGVGLAAVTPPGQGGAYAGGMGWREALCGVGVYDGWRWSLF